MEPTDYQLDFWSAHKFSSTIKKVGYSYSHNVMGIQFTAGQIYHYFGVPKDVFETILGSESKGKLLHSLIKGKYQYKIVNENPDILPQLSQAGFRWAVQVGDGSNGSMAVGETPADAVFNFKSHMKLLPQSAVPIVKKNFAIRQGRDGFWLELTCKDGSSALLSLSNYFFDHQHMVGSIFQAWATENSVEITTQALEVEQVVIGVREAVQKLADKIQKVGEALSGGQDVTTDK